MVEFVVGWMFVEVLQSVTVVVLQRPRQIAAVVKSLRCHVLYDVFQSTIFIKK